MIDINTEIIKLKKEAITLLGNTFKISEKCESTSIERIIDCIISVAILEITNLNTKIIPKS